MDDIRGDGLSVQCWVVSAMFLPSIFEDRCVDLRRSLIDVSTFEDRWSMCRPSKIDGRCVGRVDFRRLMVDVGSRIDGRCVGRVDLR